MTGRSVPEVCCSSTNSSPRPRMARSPPTQDADNLTGERNLAEGASEVSCGKAVKAKKAPEPDHTIYESIATPVKPATTNLTHRWEKENKEDIEVIRKVYSREEVPKTGKMTLPELSVLSTEMLQPEKTKKTSMVSAAKDRLEPPIKLLEEETTSCMTKEDPKTIDMEQETKTLYQKETNTIYQKEPKTLYQKEPKTLYQKETESRVEQAQTLERSEKPLAQKKMKVRRLPENASPPPMTPYYTAMTSPFRSPAKSNMSKEKVTDPNSRSQKSQKSEKKLHKVRGFASSVASHTKNLLLFGCGSKESDTSRKSDRKQRQNGADKAKEASLTGNQKPLQKRPASQPDAVNTAAPQEHS
ncbi:hypothetical protein QR680_009004 [Steinernema hermaphroditum]|uniref:Uncharacterized protein n=1 Tax=Steinernema hermaphroditum TaxID=289476 RepID=A0AA39IIN9_9BILA|nr:hypothetical protein QR680_009004 [Steinernema hermaphroditum]